MVRQRAIDKEEERRKRERQEGREKKGRGEVKRT